MRCDIVVKRDSKTGYYTGRCRQLPEAISQGETLDELFENMKEAIVLVLEEQQDTQKTRKCGLDLALEDVEAGRVYSAKDVDDMFRQILGEGSASDNNESSCTK